MSWANPLHKGNQVFYFGAEAAFGSLAATMIRTRIVGNAPPLGKAARKMLPNADIRVRRIDGVAPIAGLQSESPVEFSVYAKQVKTALAFGTAPVAFDNAAALGHQVVYRATWGAELTPAQGSKVVASAGGPPLNVVEVTAGGAADFVAGQMIAVEVGVAGGSWEIRRVIDVDLVNDELTVAPAFNGTPFPTGAVRNLYCYYVPEALDTQSYSVQHAYYETAAEVTQRQALGCHFTGSMDLKIGEVPTVKLAGKSVTHTTPADLSLVVDETAVDDMGAPIVWEPCGWLVSTASLAAAPVTMAVHEVSFDLARSWQDLPGCGVEGLQSRVETSGRDKRPTVTLKGTTTADTAPWTAFDAGTAYHFTCYTEVGTGAAARHIGVCFPRLVIEEEPVFEELGELVSWTAKFTAHQAEDIVSWVLAVAATPETSLSPAWFFVG